MTAPVTEKGYAAQSALWWPDEDENTPELVWPRSVEVYGRMRRQDAQVGSVLRAVTTPLRRTAWRIDPNGARPEVVKLVSEDVGLPIVGEAPKPLPRTRDRFSFTDHLRLALTMLPFGHSFFEQQARYVDGVARLRKLAWRPPRTISKFDVAEDGGLVAIEQYATGSGKERRIPVEHLVAYVSDREGGAWTGQALAPETPIPTPAGWTTIGELREGDEVFDEQGTVCRVVARREWADRPCYRVTFDDGEEIVADENHQWLSYERIGACREPKVVTTADMASRVIKYGVPAHALKIAGPLQTPDVDLPVDPYVLGAWLGDGSTDNGSARICDAEGDVVTEIARRGYRIAQRDAAAAARSWTIAGLITGLRAAGIVEGSGRKRPVTYRKFVPAVYLRGSEQQRIDLLRGLMDTDGCFDPANGQCIFVNTEKALVDAVVELANSLGAKTRVQYVHQAGAVATMKSGALIQSRRDVYKVKFTATFLAFAMERKAKQQDLERAAKRPYHYVRSVEMAPNQNTVCIQVDSKSHLFLCGNGFKPTHNSLLRPAYKFWLLKDRALRTQATTLERNGLGVPVYEGGPYADDLADQERKAIEDVELAEGAKLAAALRGGDNSGAAVRNGAKLTLMGVSGTLPDADPVIRYYDEQIARAVLAHFLNLGTETGSWALGSTFADFFTLSLESIAQVIDDVFSQHVIEDMVDWNWGPEEPAPRLVHDEIGSRHPATAQAIQQLIACGALTPDEPLEQYLRTTYGLPAHDPATAREKPAAAPSEPAQPAPPAEQQSPQQRRLV